MNANKTVKTRKIKIKKRLHYIILNGNKNYVLLKMSPKFKVKSEPEIYKTRKLRPKFNKLDAIYKKIYNDNTNA